MIASTRQSRVPDNLDILFVQERRELEGFPSIPFIEGGREGDVMGQI
jgi:hypothetical protein